MSSMLATPASAIRMASRLNIAPRRDDANPGVSCTSMAVFPISSTYSSAMASVFSLVRSATTISTSGMMCVGLKKCRPSVRLASSRTLASSVTERDDVFVAMTASSGAPASTSWKTSFLIPMSSGTASMARSASATASESDVVPSRRASVASTSSAVAFSRSTASSRLASTCASPSSTSSRSTSRTTTSWPARALTCAIPWPIAPAPITAMSMYSTTVRRDIRGPQITFNRRYYGCTAARADWRPSMPHGR